MHGSDPASYNSHVRCAASSADGDYIHSGANKGTRNIKSTLTITKDFTRDEPADGSKVPQPTASCFPAQPHTHTSTIQTEGVLCLGCTVPTQKMAHGRCTSSTLSKEKRFNFILLLPPPPINKPCITGLHDVGISRLLATASLSSIRLMLSSANLIHWHVTGCHFSLMTRECCLIPTKLLLQVATLIPPTHPLSHTASILFIAFGPYFDSAARLEGADHRSA